MSGRKGSTDPRFAWCLSQSRIELLAETLYKVETILNIASPGSMAADDIARLLTDLRVQATAAGATDPFPDMPYYPRFAETEVPYAWPEDAEREAA